jgi:protein sidekick
LIEELFNLKNISTGNPRLEFRWLKDGHPLTDYLPEHFYKIQSLRREDAGNYSCIAKNEVGAIFSNKFDVSVACEYFSTRL